MEPDYSVVSEQELTTFPSDHTREYLDTCSSSGRYSTFSESSDTETATSVPDGIRRSPGDSSQSSGAIVVADHSHQIGISLFQGYRFSTY